MNAPEQLTIDKLPDVQSETDARAVKIEKVGIRGLKYPLDVSVGNCKFSSIGTLDMTVSLAANIKGTHMSRFIEVLRDYKQPINHRNLISLGSRMLDKLDAESGWIKLTLPFFIEKEAPVSKVRSLMDYEVTWEVAVSTSKDNFLTLNVVVPVTSLCPCSKNISDYGAHNQRSHISVSVTLIDLNIDVEKIVEIAEKSASCELWGLLKRPDEKYVTEKAYDNPKFVEDLVRDVAIHLKQLKRSERILKFSIESENFESIHNHSAYARVESY
ncbi:MAG: GTP cyclohydrolase I FolE2 [Betaproteobacteria bacterium TMED82]|nr:MAG: GTP cyclohydrolase I FolE2 [Betaproteobacteria bacterium TMED82]|tara:strand:+ start:2391 stop:3203 length:813 start_codon:yes stop_codon:yes gene_type:complete